MAYWQDLIGRCEFIVLNGKVQDCIYAKGRTKVINNDAIKQQQNNVTIGITLLLLL